MIGGFGKTTLPAFGVRAALGGFAVLAGLAVLAALGVFGVDPAPVGPSALVEVMPTAQRSALLETRRSVLLPARRDTWSTAAAAPVDAALVQAESRVGTLIESLAGRLKTQPDDVDGWRTLARAYAALGRHAAAIDAFKAALRLRPDEPALLADFAFSVAVLDPHAASGESARLIARALQLDPLNPKALALAGTLAFDRNDYPGAIVHWEQLARVEPAEGPSAKQLQLSILQTRQLAATRGGTAPAPQSMPTLANASREPGAGRIDSVARESARPR